MNNKPQISTLLIENVLYSDIPNMVFFFFDGKIVIILLVIIFLKKFIIIILNI